MCVCVYLVAVVDGRCDLSENASGFCFRQSPSLQDVIIQLASAGVLHHNHNLVPALKHCNITHLHQWHHPDMFICNIFLSPPWGTRMSATIHLRYEIIFISSGAVKIYSREQPSLKPEKAVHLFGLFSASKYLHTPTCTSKYLCMFSVKPRQHQILTEYFIVAIWSVFAVCPCTSLVMWHRGRSLIRPEQTTLVVMSRCDVITWDMWKMSCRWSKPETTL